MEAVAEFQRLVRSAPSEDIGAIRLAVVLAMDSESKALCVTPADVEAAKATLNAQPDDSTSALEKVATAEIDICRWQLDLSGWRSFKVTIKPEEAQTITEHILATVERHPASVRVARSALYALENSYPTDKVMAAVWTAMTTSLADADGFYTGCMTVTQLIKAHSWGFVAGGDSNTNNGFNIILRGLSIHADDIDTTRVALDALYQHVRSLGVRCARDATCTAVIQALERHPALDRLDRGLEIVYLMNCGRQPRRLLADA